MFTACGRSALQLTPHQAKYIAHDLTLQHAGGGLERLSQALFNAARLFLAHQPIQLRCALFASTTSANLCKSHAYLRYRFLLKKLNQYP